MATDRKGKAVASAFVAAVMGLSLGSGIAVADDGPPPNTIRLPIEIPGITPFVDIPLPSQEDVDGINAALAGASAEMDRLAREFMDALDRLTPTERQLTDMRNSYYAAVDEFGKRSEEAKNAADSFNKFLRSLQDDIAKGQATDEQKAAVGKSDDKAANKESQERQDDADVRDVLEQEKELEKVGASAGGGEDTPPPPVEDAEDNDTPPPPVSSGDGDDPKSSSSNAGRPLTGYIK